VDRRLSYPRGPAQGPVHEPTHRPLARGGFPLVQDCNPCDPQGTLGKPPPVPGSTQRPDLGRSVYRPGSVDDQHVQRVILRWADVPPGSGHDLQVAPILSNIRAVTAGYVAPKVPNI
jgi:hypothetical protein